MKLMAIVCSVAGLTLCLLASTAAQAELYKSIAADGRVTYSDTVPISGKIIETTSLSVNTDSDLDSTWLPYALAQAKKTSPVTLYTSGKCIPCDDSRKMLTARGIPFREKTINTNDDIAHLKQVGGTSVLPLVLIGSNKQSGFEALSWNDALSAAGYPSSNQLPKTYKNGQATAAVPAVTSRSASEPDDTPALDRTLRPAAGTTPPGFRF